MGYRLGVDVGTTFTAAAVDDGSGPRMVGLGNRALQVPSVLFLQGDGTFLFGEAAERRGSVEPATVVREFKRRLGDTVPILVAGKPFSPQALTARLLSFVIAAVTEREGASPEEVVLTHPANWGGYKRELMDQVIAMADLPSALTCTEPEAAAIQYASRANLAEGAKVAVYDLGGGTFDICVLAKQPTGFRILGAPEGVEHLGGIDFDEAVFQHVLRGLGEQVARLDLDDPQVTTALTRLRRDCVEAKEALSNDVDTAIPVHLPGVNTTVRLTRAELESLITPALRDTLAATHRALRSAQTSPDQLAAIVLVGGSSRIPLVSHLLNSEFAVPTAMDTHPKHDIALGAVQYHPRTPDQTAPLPAPTVETWPTRANPKDAGTTRTQSWWGTTVSPDLIEPEIEAEIGFGTQPQIEQEPDVQSRELETQPAPETQIQPDKTEPEAGSHPESHREQPPSPVVGPRPGPPPEPGPTSDSTPDSTPGPTPNWRMLGIVAACVVVAAVLAIVVTQLNSGDGTDNVSSGQASLPESVVLLTRVNDDGNGQLIAVDTASGKTRVVPAGPSVRLPTISADRAWMVYLEGDDKGRVPVLAPVDGRDPKALLVDEMTETCPYTDRPAWSPDGKALALVCLNQDRTPSGLYVVTRDGEQVEELVHSTETVGSPSWGEDGRVYYIISPGSGRPSTLWSIPADGGGEATQVTFGENDWDSHPDWSDEGLLFLRSSQHGGPGDVWLLLPDGRPRRLTNSGDAESPAASPDGTARAWLEASSDDEELSTLWVQHDGGEPTELLTGDLGPPAWGSR